MKRPVASALATALIATALMIDFAFIATAQSKNGQPVAASEPLRVSLPVKDGSVRFLVIGDTGSGAKEQSQLAQVMLRYKEVFPFEFVLMMGDNLYGGEAASDYKAKFENVYKPFLDAKVKFYATLGNHDESNQRFYDHFNMNGNEYYSFKKDKVTFYSLNSNYMDPKQIKWIEDEMSKDDSAWKIAFFHHPPYSSGKKHGSDDQLREVIEPILVKHGVDVVFTGHEHFYERIKPQKGIYYFISGAGGKLRPGDVKASNLTEKSFDKDLSFMLIEIVGDQMHFQVISRTGATIDEGVLTNSASKIKAAN